ncbi:class I SAM-dependent methyltransferase [Tropicimonas sp. IMCC34043]|uniref:class I SAM-dependent methyltransferase n=1 Tax=Tropicimonas sp. IMCC34043 TaxID=2248760 RepID=UPI000E26CBEE|nr:class I SAM-dependent methyltransferase [Tropicimonas sp. IMCC34043]
MVESERHDAWQTGGSYDAYMGRWSRAVAQRFVDWLGAAPQADWLDVGCGTGALSAAILDRCNPRSLLGIDLSEGFLAAARANADDPRAEFRVGDGAQMDLPAASRDVVVSGLVLNFLPERDRVLAEQRRVARPGGLVGFYVWDYPGNGLGFLDAFWQAAAALDPGAAEFDEARRFPFCTPEGLTALAARAGLPEVEIAALEVPTVFADFDDFWRPFTLGTGPAPGYCASLAADQRQRLEDRLRDRLPRAPGGSIAMTARAWAVRSRLP